MVYVLRIEGFKPNAQVLVTDSIPGLIWNDRESIAYRRC